MPTVDPAKVIVTALVENWTTAHPTWDATLHVDNNYQPTAGSPLLLVADDGGPAIHAGPWMLNKSMRRITIRLTAFAEDRDEARSMVDAAVDHIVAHRPAGIGRIEDLSAPLITRDRHTRAFLASVLMPVLVRPA